MPAATSLLATATELLADRAKHQIHAAWLQPGSRSMDRMADSIVDELLQAMTALHDYRIAQICGLPPEGAPLLDHMQQVLSSLVPLVADRAQYSKPSAPANSAFG